MEKVLFSLEVFRNSSGVGSVEEAGHSEEHKDSISTKIGVSVHG